MAHKTMEKHAMTFHFFPARMERSDEANSLGSSAGSYLDTCLAIVDSHLGTMGRVCIPVCGGCVLKLFLVEVVVRVVFAVLLWLASFATSPVSTLAAPAAPALPAPVAISVYVYVF